MGLLLLLLLNRNRIRQRQIPFECAAPGHYILYLVQCAVLIHKKPPTQCKK